MELIFANMWHDDECEGEITQLFFGLLWNYFDWKNLGASRQEKSCQLSQLPSTVHSRCWVCSSGNRLCLVVDLLALGVFGKSTRWPNLPMVVSGQFVSGFAQGCAKLLAWTDLSCRTDIWCLLCKLVRGQSPCFVEFFCSFLVPPFVGRLSLSLNSTHHDTVVSSPSADRLLTVFRFFFHRLWSHLGFLICRQAN